MIGIAILVFLISVLVICEIRYQRWERRMDEMIRSITDEYTYTCTTHYVPGTCPIADRETGGDYFCTLDAGHTGPCPAVPTKRAESTEDVWSSLYRSMALMSC